MTHAVHNPSGPVLSARHPSATVVPVLIQVPTLSSAARRQARPPGRRRRRLRREVRVAGSALLFAAPMSWALLAAFGATSDAPARGDLAPPAVSISLEPAALVPSPVGEGPAPVVLEGIVPDLGPEEAAHAGG
jgi:hypothetical protein